MIDFLANVGTPKEQRREQRKARKSRNRPDEYRESQAELMARKRALERDIKIPECANPARRAECEADTPKWMRTYLHGWYPKPFSPNQLEIIESLEDSIVQGGFCCRAMDRGGGKTTIGKGLTLKCIFMGQIKFAFCATATSAKAQDEFLAPFLLTLETNELLIADYPEVCVPFVKLEGKAIRARSQTYKGERTFISITKGITFPTIEGSRCSGSVFKAYGLTSASRGAQNTTAEGDVQRPDFIFFDDPQTDESAASVQQTKKRERIITSMVGMAGPGEKMSGYMACTIIEDGDLSGLFLDRKSHPEWFGKIYSMVNKWPDAKETLWEEYLEIRRKDMENDDRECKGSVEYYKAHFEEMNKGAEVSWEGRQLPGDLTPIQSAFNMVLEVGGWDTFMAEYQNKPIKHDESIYDLTPATVASRLNGFKRLEVPDEATMLTAMGDCNYVGINVTVAAFKNDFTGWIVDHFKYPEGEKNHLVKPGTPENVAAKKIAQGILDVEKILEAKGYNQSGDPMDIDLIQFDANWLTEHVMAAIRQIRKRHVIANRGTSVKKYRVPRKSNKKREGLIGSPHHKCHREWGPQGKQVKHDADFWRATTQKAFLLSPGVSGSLSLWGNDPNRHMSYAHEICCEKLRQFAPGEPNDLYEWTMVPGQANDQLDSTVGCVVGAAMCGASLDGIKRKRRKKRQQNRNTGTSTNKPQRKIRTKYS
jgi:hypothetical protein